MLILCSCLHLNRKTKSPQGEKEKNPKKPTKKQQKINGKYIIIQKKKLFVTFIYIFFVEFWSNLTLFTRKYSARHSPSQSVYLSVFPFVWLSLYYVIAMFARTLNEFVDLLKTKSFRCHYKAYYTNLFAATDLIMIAKMYLVFEEGTKINTIS